MNSEYRNKLADFLSRYVDIEDCQYGYGHEKVIQQGIKLLIDSGLFNTEQLRKKILKDKSIIVSREFIMECVKRVK